MAAGATKHQGSGTAGVSLCCIAVSALVLALLPSVHPLANNYIAPGLVSVLPFAYLLQVGLACELLDALILTSLWTPYLLLLFWPFSFLLGRYTILCVYSPLFVIFAKRPYTPPGSLFLKLQTVLWDWPLIIWVRVLCAVSRRGLRPFYSEIDDFISMGSMPVGLRDARQLSALNVGAVVNLCREYRGPTAAYLQQGIVQHHAPTADVCEPSFSTLLRAVRFINTYRLAEFGSGGDDRLQQHQQQQHEQQQHQQTEKKKRVFVHCKAGRARSAAVVYCYLLTRAHSGGARLDADGAAAAADGVFARLMRARPIVEASVRHMRVVRLFHQRLLAAGGSLDAMEVEAP